MTKKKVAMVVGAMALSAVMAVGGTLAYLQATTATKANVFTSSNNITPELKEEQWDKTGKQEASNYKPGDVIAKDPTISIKAGSEAGYVAISLNYLKDLTNTEEATMAGTSITKTEFLNYATPAPNYAAGWTLIAKNANGSELYMYGTALAPTTTDVSAPAIFTNVTVQAGITTVTTTSTSTHYTRTYKTDGTFDSTVVDPTKITTNTSYYDAAGNVCALNSLPSFGIKATGYAVQANVNGEALTTAAAAAQLIALANAGITDSAALYTAVQ